MNERETQNKSEREGNTCVNMVDLLCSGYVRKCVAKTTGSAQLSVLGDLLKRSED